MFSRRISIRPGTLRRISSPIIAVQKNRTPLVLEPDRGRLWAHDPLKGSYRVAPGDLEEELTGRAYELIPDLPPGPIGPKRFLGLAFAHLGASIRRLIGASLVVTFFGMFTPVATGWIFGQAIPSSQADLLTAIGLALMAAAAAAALFSMFRSMIEINFEALADTRLASMLMSRLLRLPVSFFRRYSIGDLSMRFRAVLEIRQLLTSAVLSVGLNGIFSLFYLFLMFKYSAQLAWYGLGLGAAVAAIMIAIFRVVTGMQRSMLARRAKEQSILYELINGILVVRSSGAGRRLYNRWLNSFGSEMKMYYKSL
jgi:ABC-type bacteriocin/lantibiotic exporter with double-glycine peptidase domain